MIDEYGIKPGPVELIALVAFFDTVVENCAIAASEASRSFAEPVDGCSASAGAVRAYGRNLGK